MSETCIIVGASHAGAQLAASLRQEGWTGRILMLGDEPHLPYNRPPLSKGYMSGEKTFQDILIRHEDAYNRHNIELRLGVTVAAIDRAAKKVVLADGERLAYDKLALCTGARVRRLPNADQENVLYLRTLNDLERIRAHAGEGRRAVVIGGGYIGLETAAALRKFGTKVTVVEAAPRVLARVTAPEMSTFYQRVHAEEGVTIITGARIAGLRGTPRAEAVNFEGGAEIEADFFVVGIGVLPNTELAEAAGLRVDDGIVTDEYARTDDPDIVAAGDCTVHPVKDYGTCRLESVSNAVEQAKAAAATICGKEKPDQSLPWFWSDQFDLKLQMAGLNTDYDRMVLRGDPAEGRSFAAFYLRQGAVIAVDCVNRPSEFVLSKKLIMQRRVIDPAMLADESRPFKEVAA